LSSSSIETATFSGAGVRSLNFSLPFQRANENDSLRADESWSDRDFLAWNWLFLLPNTKDKVREKKMEKNPVMGQFGLFGGASVLASRLVRSLAPPRLYLSTQRAKVDGVVQADPNDEAELFSAKPGAIWEKSGARGKLAGRAGGPLGTDTAAP